MRKLAIAPVAAITVGAALPAAAQVGFYAGSSGIGVGVGSPYYYHHRLPLLAPRTFRPQLVGKLKRRENAGLAHGGAR